MRSSFAPCFVAVLRPLFLSCLALLLWAQRAPAQDEILWYSFESKTGTVANRAAGALRGPASARIVSTNKKGDRVPGFQVDAKGAGDWALASFDDWDSKKRRANNYNYLDTGWKKGVSGDLTIAFFVRYGLTTAPGGAQYVFGGDDGFRCFTEGRASNGLAVAGWGGIGYLDLDFDLRTASGKGWVHVALVLADSERQVRWYIDGKLFKTQSLLQNIKIAARKQGFRIGAHTSLKSPNVWHIDEFRMAKGARTEAEIQAWRYQSGKVGDGCGATLASRGTRRPLLGGKPYPLDVRSKPEALAIMALGFSSTKIAGVIPLPFELGKAIGKDLDGCKWHTSSELFFALKTDKQGLAAFSLPIPALTGLSGLTLWAQALVPWVDSQKAKRWQSTNAWRVVFVPR